MKWCGMVVDTVRMCGFLRFYSEIKTGPIHDEQTNKQRFRLSKFDFRKKGCQASSVRIYNVALMALKIMHLCNLLGNAM